MAPDIEIHFERLAVTPEQIEAWDLPSRPRKATDTRTKNFGAVSVELDASAADCNARDTAITFSIAVQHGVDPETIRRAVCRDSHGRASGPLGTAMDIIFEQERDR
jgi:hypothetical protein